MRHARPQSLEPDDAHRRALGVAQTRPAHLLPGRRPVWGCFVHLSALRLDDGEWLILATFGAPQEQAINAYADRWQVETLFGCLKTRGFNFEDTHLKDAAALVQNDGACSRWPLPGPTAPANSFMTKTGRSP
jgi:hypothetical protein